MKVNTILWIISVIIIGSTPVNAKTSVDEKIDSLVSSTQIIELGEGLVTSRKASDQATRLKIMSFYYDQFRHSQDPDAPFFLFMSKDGSMSMGIGGTLRMRGWYEWGGALPTTAFTPALIPMQTDPTNSKHLGTTPAGVCLYFRVLGSSKVIGNYRLYIEANFNGYESRDFHLKKAYADIGDFTIGYASSTFSDPASVPSTVDAAGPNNKIGHTSVLLRYMPHITDNLIAALSVEAPDTQIDDDNISTKACTDYIPDIATLIQYEWAQGRHIRLAAIIRSLPYRDMVNGRNYNTTGWGVHLSGVGRPIDPITLYINANYGNGIGSLGGDLLVGKYDLIARPDTPGRLYAPRSFGWCVGVQYNIRPNLFVSGMASQTRLLPSGKCSPDDYKHGIMGAINVFWDPIPRMQLGAEFDFGKRQNFSGEHRYARRLGALIQLSF